MNLKKKLVFGAVAVLSLALFTIILWEQVRDEFFSNFNTEVSVTREEQVELTLDALIDARAKDWLISSEALLYARTQVTEDVIAELSKI